MSLPITDENLEKISDRFRALFHQIITTTQQTMIHTEQIDPLYIHWLIQSLLCMKYQHHKP
jgi:hypothetical protein